MRKSQPGPCANQEETETTDQQEGTDRRHAAWEDIGIAEYNPQTTKWECRFGDFQHELISGRLTHYSRNKQHPEHNHGENRKEIARQNSNKTYIAQDKLLTHVEVAPPHGNHNVEISPNMK